MRPTGGALPGRQHLDPAAIPRLLPWLWILDVHRAPLRFKYRLVGTEQVAALGSDLTGQWLDEAHARFERSLRFSDYQAAAERGEITYRRGRPTFHVDKDHVALERQLLPLARDGATVDMLLAITVYYSAVAARASLWARS